MALNIKIDFNDCYTIETLTKDLTLSRFNTTLKNGQVVPIGINISDDSHPLLPDVYNLAFGPIGENNQIDDNVKLYHENHSKLFSTIVFTGLTFLRNNNDKYLGINGSDNARAYLYYRCIQNNYNYLNQFFNIYGVFYYVRVLRKQDNKDDGHPVDEENVIAIPQLIKQKEIMKHPKLYNYFIFNCKN